MKPFLLPLLSFFFYIYAQANINSSNPNSDSVHSIYEQLCGLNKYWLSHESYEPSLSDKVQFAEHEDLIQLHLKLVEQHLRQKDVSSLSASQQQNRTEALNVLKTYWQEKQFPKNTRHTSITPYFIDDFNTACAVGHLMRESGASQQAHWIAETMNNAYIEDMPLQELQQWADKMGFEVAELKWIQPAYGAFAWEFTENADCHEDNGRIEMDVYLGGVCEEVEDSYIWYDYSGEQIKRICSGKKLENAPAGFYRFQVNLSATDVYHCRPNRFVGIADSGGPQINAVVNQPDIGVDNGEIFLHISNGTPPYKIEWYDFNENPLGGTISLHNLKGYSDMVMHQGFDYTHRVKVTDANGCKAFENFYLYGFTDELPVPLFIPHIQNTPEGHSEGSIHIETLKSLTYQWSHDPQLTKSTAQNLPAGIYTVTITQEDTQESYVRQFEIVEEELTDIAKHLLGELKIYPTLTSKTINIELPSTQSDYMLEVFNQNGQLVESKEVSTLQQSHLLQTQHLPKGMYFVSMKNNKGSFAGKFIRQ